jgi:hypothetical protein
MLHIHRRKKYHTSMKNTDSITARHADSITGSISCFDRLILQGTLNPCGHPSGMTSLLYQRSIRIFDFPQFSKPITEKIRANILSIAQRNDVPITIVRKHTDRKENLVAEIISKRGNHPGIICILSAMETCSTFEPSPVANSISPASRTGICASTSPALLLQKQLVSSNGSKSTVLSGK